MNLAEHEAVSSSNMIPSKIEGVCVCLCMHNLSMYTCIIGFFTMHSVHDALLGYTIPYYYFEMYSGESFSSVQSHAREWDGGKPEWHYKD